jgi:hypothetical protein
MKALSRSLIVGAVQILLVASVGAKFLYDRSHYPRVWAQTVPFDPDLPIRGRYVSISVRVETARAPAAKEGAELPGMYLANLEIYKDRLYAVEDDNGRNWVESAPCGEQKCWQLSEPVAFFIPEDVEDPSRRPPGETLWVEVTVPPRGPPRPLRLGIKKADDAEVTPLQLRAAD